MKLLINDKPAIRGEIYKDFRGEEVVLVNWSEPKERGKSGYVQLRGIHDPKDCIPTSYYPQVINGVFVMEENEYDMEGLHLHLLDFGLSEREADLVMSIFRYIKKEEV